MSKYDVLLKKYPRLFGDKFHGFECGEGWFEIIESLCGAIDFHVQASRNRRARVLVNNRILSSAKKGDVYLLHRVFDKPYLPSIILKDIEYKEVPIAMNRVVVHQVKEKFGGLRFYTSYEDEFISGCISMAESMCNKTCEICGAPGKMKRIGWLRVLCDKHRE